MMFARAGSTRSGLEEEELFLKKIWAWHTQDPKLLPKSISIIHTHFHESRQIGSIIQRPPHHCASKSKAHVKHHST